MDCNCYENYTCLNCETKKNWTLIPENVKNLLLLLQESVDRDDFELYREISLELAKMGEYGVEDIPAEFISANKYCGGIEIDPEILV